jgi:nicotinamidase-related amidase
MKPALLVIDVQNEYFSPHGQWVLPEGRKALEAIQQLISAFRAVQLPVIHIAHEEPDPASPIFRTKTIAVEIIPEITILPGEARILKHVPGAFTQTELETLLRNANCDTVVVCGFMTHLCCDTTTRQASERGFAILFASDATATHDLELHGKVVPYQVIQETTLAIMTEFATVLSTADTVEILKDL